jgi:hypothetical protein
MQTRTLLVPVGVVVLVVGAAVVHEVRSPGRDMSSHYLPTGTTRVEVYGEAGNAGKEVARGAARAKAAPVTGSIVVIVTPKAQGHVWVYGPKDWKGGIDRKIGERITGLRPGRYRLVIGAARFLNENKTVNVTGGQETVVRIKLRRDPVDAQIIEGAPVPGRDKPKPAASSVNPEREKKAVLQVIRAYMKIHLMKSDLARHPKDRYFDWRFAGDWCAVCQALYFAQDKSEGVVSEFVLRRVGGQWKVRATLGDDMPSRSYLRKCDVSDSVARQLKIRSVNDLPKKR